MRYAAAAYAAALAPGCAHSGGRYCGKSRRATDAPPQAYAGGLDVSTLPRAFPAPHPRWHREPRRAAAPGDAGEAAPSPASLRCLRLCCCWASLSPPSLSYHQTCLKPCAFFDRTSQATTCAFRKMRKERRELRDGRAEPNARMFLARNQRTKGASSWKAALSAPNT